VGIKKDLEQLEKVGLISNTKEKGTRTSFDANMSPEQVRAEVEQSLGKPAVMEVQETCWCGCGRATKIYMRPERPGDKS
jgi:hypothetical protein